VGVYCLSLDPEKELNYAANEAEQKATEKDLFEALWLIFSGVAASGANVEHKISLKSALRDYSVEGGSIKLAVCPCCGQRWMIHGRLRTIDKPVDIFLEKEEFEFLKACPEQWQRVTGELEDHFAELKARFKKMEAKPEKEWRKIIEEREAPPALHAVAQG